MDRNALLQATRTRFLDAFLLAVEQRLIAVQPSGLVRTSADASATGQRTTLEASHLLLDRQSELRGQLRQRMEQLLDRSLQTTYSTFRPSFSKNFTSDKLTLIDFTQLENQLLIDEITTRFRNAADHALRDLNVRIALLFEQNTIKERENPFRPWLFTQCIVSAIEALGTRPEVTSVLLQQIAGRIENDVASIYDNVNAFLAENGIAAHLQLNRPASSVNTPAPPASTLTPLYNIQPRTASQPDRPVSATLIQALQALYAPNSTPDSTPDSKVIGRQNDLGSDALHNCVRADRNALIEATQDTGERSMIDTVAGLLDFIFNDDHTDQPIRVQLARLQLRILETALKEPAFFTQPAHPARMLINRMGGIALDTQNARASGKSLDCVRITAEIRQIISSALPDDGGKITPFSATLVDLEALIAKDFAEGAFQQAHAVRVLALAQRGMPHFVSLCAQLDTAMSGLIVDPFLRDFLAHTWTLVIDSAEQQDGVVRPIATQLRKLVPDLMWSIVPHRGPEKRAQLLAILPTLTRSIRSGLTAIGWPPARQQPALDWLMQVHRNCLRENNDAMQTLSLEAVHKHFQKFVIPNVVPEVLATIVPPYSIVQQHYLDRAIRRIDMHLRLESPINGDMEKRLRYVERLPLFDRAIGTVSGPASLSVSWN